MVLGLIANSNKVFGAEEVSTLSTDAFKNGNLFEYIVPDKIS